MMERYLEEHPPTNQYTPIYCLVGVKLPNFIVNNNENQTTQLTPFRERTPDNLFFTKLL